MIVKISKKLFWVLKVFIVVAIIAKIVDYMSDYTTFAYGLKTKPIQKVSYLPDSNVTLLPIDENTVAIYSIRKETDSLEEIFKIAGIPYYLCAKLQDANKSKILFLDWDINKKGLLEENQVAFLEQFVSYGGMLIGNETENLPQLKKIFGYRAILPSKNHRSFTVTDTTYTKYLDQQEERGYILSSLNDIPYTNTIVTDTAKPLAIFDGETTAISINHHNKGEAIMLGVSAFDLRYRNLFGKDFNANKSYCNSFEPLSDMLILLLKGIYEKEIKQTLTLSTAPYRYRSSLVVTHDVDYIRSMPNMKKFIKMEKALGIRSTYFIQTKYLTDDKDQAFFYGDNLNTIIDADKEGFEIGSHTVMHTKNFFTLPEGNYSESYPNYQPFSFNDKKDLNNPMLSGELKVSKELLDGLCIHSVHSFRSGELIYHPKLSVAMERLGYRYSSCFSAGDVLSYFPYRYKREYGTLTNQSFIWEIPLVYEDEEFPPLYFRVDKALSLFDKIHKNGGVFNLLIHPDMTISRLKNLDIYFEKSFIEKLPKEVWIATIRDIGAFWDKRDRVVFRYHLDKDLLQLYIYSQADIEGLAFDMHHIALDPNTDQSVKIENQKLILTVKKGLNHWDLKIL